MQSLILSRAPEFTKMIYPKIIIAYNLPFALQFRLSVGLQCACQIKSMRKIISFCKLAVKFKIVLARVGEA